MADDMTNDSSLVTSITLNVIAGHSSLPYADYINLSALPASNRFKNVFDEDRIVIPGHAKHEPGISRFRVWSFGPSRNDETNKYGITDHDAA
jgi:hypothetical protein